MTRGPIRPATHEALQQAEPPQATPVRRARSLLERVRQVALVPAIAILLAIVVGALLMLASSPLVVGRFEPLLWFTAYRALVIGAFGSFNALTSTMVNATPLILAGFAVGIGFKAGLFNIGAQGQFLIGALCAAAVAVGLNDASPLVAIPAALLAGCAGGLAYGFIPGALKGYTGAHEVVTTIMLNFVAISIVAYTISGPLRGENVTFARTDAIVAAGLPVIVGRDGHIGLLLAALAVPLVWLLLFRSTLGFEIRTVGANPEAARYAGMHPRRLVVLTMAMCGTFAGLAGGIEILGRAGFMPASFSTTVGFDAIAVALLGRAHPVGILFAGLLFGAMRAGAGLMQIQAGIPVQMINVLQAVILFFLAADLIIRHLFRVRAASAGVSELQTVTRSYGEQSAR